MQTCIFPVLCLVQGGIPNLHILKICKLYIVRKILIYTKVTF